MPVQRVGLASLPKKCLAVSVEMCLVKQCNIGGQQQTNMNWYIPETMYKSIATVAQGGVKFVKCPSQFMMCLSVRTL